MEKPLLICAKLKNTSLNCPKISSKLGPQVKEHQQIQHPKILSIEIQHQHLGLEIHQLKLGPDMGKLHKIQLKITQHIRLEIGWGGDVLTRWHKVNL